MAVITKPFCRISAHGALVLEVFEDYEDTDWRATNDDGDPDDFRVVRWHGTNHSAYPHTVLVKRGNGQAWMERTIPPGEPFSQNAGGPVKYESDVPVWTYS